MYIFLKRSGLFILGLIIIVFSSFIFSRIYLNKSKLFNIDKDTNIVVLGDSHTRYSFNDKILHNTFNLSSDADSYFYSYLKLKQLNKANPQIDTLLLSFSQHNVHKFIENRWILNNTHLMGRLKQYLPLLDVEEFLFLMNKKPKQLCISLFSQIFFPFHVVNGISSYGGYKELKKNILIDELKRMTNEGREEYDNFIESTIEKEYLDKIVNYCANNEILLILVNPPLHKSIHNKQNDLFSFYEKYYKGVLFFDFSRIEVDDIYFADLVHLNYQGANYFSELILNENLFVLQNAINKGILYN